MARTHERRFMIKLRRRCLLWMKLTLWWMKSMIRWKIRISLKISYLGSSVITTQLWDGF